jgi:hypothetical protein
LENIFTDTIIKNDEIEISVGEIFRQPDGFAILEVRAMSLNITGSKACIEPVSDLLAINRIILRRKV